jgi:hypothetical protein
MTGKPHGRLRGARFAAPAGCLLFLAAVCAAVPQQGPLFTIDEDCTAFAFGRDGRIAFAVHHVFSRHKFDLQRDDFWIADGGHGKHRILNGDKLDRGEGGFSYTVRSLRWSPGGTKLAAEVMTGVAAERHGNETVSVQSFLLDANGQEIKIADGDSFIPDSENPAWLDDDSTVVYLEEATKPRKDFMMWSVRPAVGHAARLFPETYFLGVAWMERTRQAVAVTSPVQGRKPRLVLLDLTKQTSKDLVTLDGYVGGLSLSPSGHKVAYFRDPGTLEVRSLANPQTAHGVQALMGRYFWTSDEEHVVMKSEPGQKSSILELLRLSDGSTDDLFNGLTFWNFGISSDGTRLGVSPPGKHVVEVFDMPVQR